MTLKTGKSIDFHLTQNVIISTVGLLTSILLLIIYLPLNNYKIDKKLVEFWYCFIFNNNSSSLSRITKERMGHYI